VLEYNNPQQLADVLEQQGDQIAAIILEPVVGNMGCVPPEPGFLEACRELCTKHGTVLIFDEVMTGFRVAYGGAQERFGVTPDLTTLGKIVGGGMPVGASGIATLTTLRDENPYPRLEETTTRLCNAIDAAATAAGIEHSIGQVGSMFTLFFNPERVVSFEQSGKSDTDRFAKYFWGMIDRGVYLPCSQFEANFVSAAHSDEDIDQTIAAASEILSGLAG
jgi:glutamate-1-semialdehyde 2,1-aminomutase